MLVIYSSYGSDPTLAGRLVPQLTHNTLTLMWLPASIAMVNLALQAGFEKGNSKHSLSKTLDEYTHVRGRVYNIDCTPKLKGQG